MPIWVFLGWSADWGPFVVWVLGTILAVKIADGLTWTVLPCRAVLLYIALCVFVYTRQQT